ncbi:MAG: hypothetical protein JWO31_128, partial [Phycisphaerales bacterium]|nr:hypothetical protein [Phycisphaerales bacterium]
ALLLAALAGAAAAALTVSIAVRFEAGGEPVPATAIALVGAVVVYACATIVAGRAAEEIRWVEGPRVTRRSGFEVLDRRP